jgi:hypothetical protein
MNDLSIYMKIRNELKNVKHNKNCIARDRIEKATVITI